jgi:alpha-galactosidase
LEASKTSCTDFINDYIISRERNSHKLWYEDNMAEDYSQMLTRIQAIKKAGYNILCFTGNWIDNSVEWVYGISDTLPISNKESLVSLINTCHESGLKFGLCIDLAVVQVDSAVLTQHPEWVVKRKDGSDYNLTDTNSKLMCLGSEYTSYMAYLIDHLVKELNIDYIRLTGKFFPDEASGGCYSKEHLHLSTGESWKYFYDGLFALMTYLRKNHPDLIIDVTPESYDPSHGIDIALMKYIDVVQ